MIEQNHVLQFDKHSVKFEDDKIIMLYIWKILFWPIPYCEYLKLVFSLRTIIRVIYLSWNTPPSYCMGHEKNIVPRLDIFVVSRDEYFV